MSAAGAVFAEVVVLNNLTFVLEYLVAFNIIAVGAGADDPYAVLTAFSLQGIFRHYIVFYAVADGSIFENYLRIPYITYINSFGKGAVFVLIGALNKPMPYDSAGTAYLYRGTVLCITCKLPIAEVHNVCIIHMPAGRANLLFQIGFTAHSIVGEGRFNQFI